MLAKSYQNYLKYTGLFGIGLIGVQLDAIANAGTVVEGAKNFYTETFNMTVEGFVPGLAIIGSDLIVPGLSMVFGAVSQVAQVQSENDFEFSVPSPMPFS